MPSARAVTPSGPSLLRVSGIAGIAIALLALAGCGASPLPDWRDGEIEASTYRLIESRSNDEEQKRVLRGFMADGKITYGELSEWNDFNERRSEPLAEVKSRLASGSAQ